MTNFSELISLSRNNLFWIWPSKQSLCVCALLWLRLLETPPPLAVGNQWIWDQESRGGSDLTHFLPDGFHLTLHACPNTRRCFSQVVMLSCIIHSWKTTLVQPGPGMLKYKCPITVSAFLIIWSLLVLLILKLGMWLVTPQPPDSGVRNDCHLKCVRVH